MRKLVGYVLVAVVLVAAGEAFRRAAGVQRQLADAESQLATLALDAVEAEYQDVENTLSFARGLPIVGPALLSDLHHHRAAAAYWRQEYDTLPITEVELDADDADPDLLFLSANASFRAAQGRPTLQAMVRDLDAVVRGYVRLLRESPGHQDGAYNYEYVVRLRNLLSSRMNLAKAGVASAPPPPNQPPPVHGDKGAPPEEEKAEEFNIIVPLRPDERGEMMKAGSSAPRARKG